MYHFYSMGLFLVIVITSFFTRSLVTNFDLQMTFLVIGCIFSGVLLINIFFFVFSNLDAQKEFRERVNSIKTLRKKEIIRKDKFDFMKKYYEEFLKLYPDHEKEIFEKIVKSRPKELTVLFEQYPELKSSVVISNLSTEIHKEMDKYFSAKTNIEDEIEKLENIKSNPWFLGLPEIPTSILKEESFRGANFIVDGNL